MSRSAPPPKPGTVSPSVSPADSRQARLAQALRANLRRRKQGVTDKAVTSRDDSDSGAES